MEHDLEDRELSLLMLAARSAASPDARRSFAAALAAPFDGERLADLADEQEIHPLLGSALRESPHDPGAGWARRLDHACMSSTGIICELCGSPMVGVSESNFILGPLMSMS